MRKFAVAISVIGALVIAGGATAAGRWVISNINQIKPSVRHQLRGNTGPSGPAGVVPQVVTVASENLTLAAGQSTYDLDPNGFEATCPAGMVVLGTGFDDGGIGQVGFVEAFGTFVGGIIFNNTGVSDAGVDLQAICGSVPNGEVGSQAIVRGARSPEARYHALLAAAQAAQR